MYQNNLFTGTSLLDRVQKVASQKYGTVYEDIGLITVHADDEGRPYFIVNDNEMDKIGTVTRAEIKQLPASG
jgi:phage-related protein